MAIQNRFATTMWWSRPRISGSRAAASFVRTAAITAAFAWALCATSSVSSVITGLGRRADGGLASLSLLHDPEGCEERYQQEQPQKRPQIPSWVNVRIRVQRM